MDQFEYMGRLVGVSGSGTKEDPWVVTGTGYNPALAAEVESQILDRALEGRRWIMERSRIETADEEQTLAILEFWILDEDGELLLAEAWFNITESFIRQRVDNL